MKSLAAETHIDHRKRTKSKFIKNGLENWLDYEVLEFALYYAIARKDTKALAKELLNKFKGFDAVLNADLKDLKTVKGISDHTALYIKLLRNISTYYLKSSLKNKDLLSSPDLVVAFLKTVLKGSLDEELHAIYLNKNNRLITVELMQKGTVDRSVVYPRKIVEKALYHHAVHVIISHNHPSGTLKPSKNDLEVTQAVKNALKTVEISLLDHIIIAGNNYLSFKEENLI